MISELYNDDDSTTTGPSVRKDRGDYIVMAEITDAAADEFTLEKSVDETNWFTLLDSAGAAITLSDTGRELFVPTNAAYFRAVRTAGANVVRITMSRAGG